MNRDPIVEETRKLRAHYAAQHGNDPLAIFADICRREGRAKERAVTFPPRPARVPAPTVAAHTRA